MGRYISMFILTRLKMMNNCMISVISDYLKSRFGVNNGIKWKLQKIEIVSYDKFSQFFVIYYVATNGNCILLDID